ncbi:ABC transporter permease [Finegoldia magna]|uniref:ABC transporter permease n=2 Tax=Finegoldia magna TaxID=1260 RepID=A0A233VYT7_FINMA|nr:ABC transporter permease [Finegoldia magna]EFK94045.1 branched-chain amino acid ABC transporter, permease protein [Finegoldia magna ACS-171-V-Col3]EFL53629.1 branched-chain amino acid ABC transporter, permease protein [Finegoldia magna BVS033A4]EXF26644.1 sugar ABC transporter permease [Finegoldia magna ALB8]MDU5441978.1 ABC transporter permease [Finegoldia magna]MDU5743162.1 ABC transporter permease [Finegoldia magna]
MNLVLLGLVIGNTLINATPILYAGLGGMVSEKSGVTNIGLEGMMTIGALIAATVGYYTHNPWLAFLCGGLSGMVFALIHAIVSITFAGDQTISAIAINYLGPGVALFVSRIFFDGATQTKPIEPQYKIPLIFDGIQNKFLANIISLPATVYLVFVLVCLIYIFMYKTKWGMRLIAVGEHPKAAETLNINVFLVRYMAVLFSGFMAGLGGATMSISLVSSFFPALVAGQGFIALVTVIFGKWTPQGVMLAALFFGFAQSVSVVLGGTNLPIPSELISMIPYVATLVVLILFGGKTKAPTADGVPYLKDDIAI